MISIQQQTILTLLTVIRERQLSHDLLDSRKEWSDTYDFIVVGAGSAGSLVAARLAEDMNKTILLIEAGGPQSVRSDIPVFKEELTGTRQDWNYRTFPQKDAHQAYIGNNPNLSRGKAFGGCSMHNDMNYYRENPEYYNFWSELTGVKNWNYSDVLPYFLKSENNYDQNIVNQDPTVHTTGGLLAVTTAVPNPILKAFLDASPDLGYPITYTEGRQPFGSTIMQRTIKDGVRQSTSLVFLENNNRRNLHILGQTLVTKILFNEKKRAIGVQFFRGNTTHNVMARDEVIVSAGSPGSAHLLMVSGVGPKYHLQNLGIPVISDLNVGEFLYIVHSLLKFDIKNQSLIEKPIENFENYYKYFIEKCGPLAYKASGTLHFQDVHYPGRPYLSNGVALPRLLFMPNNLEELVKDYKLNIHWKRYFRPYLSRAYFVVYTILKHPQGKGTIKLRSKNLFDQPIIDPCYFCNSTDFEDLLKTVKLTLDFFTSPAMNEVIEIFKGPIPGCNFCPKNKFCDSYLGCVIRKTSQALSPTGGCRIGVADDSKAVVDQRLRVFGVSSLRVIDSSIIPVSTDQSYAITLMIGEYGADMIKEDNGMHREILPK